MEGKQEEAFYGIMRSAVELRGECGLDELALDIVKKTGYEETTLAI